MALSTSPTYPVAGSAVTLSVTGVSVTKWVFEVTSVPSASSLSAGLVLEGVPENVDPPTSPHRAIELGYESATFTPDVAGEYGISIHLFRDIVATPTFPRDPAGDERVEWDSIDTATLQVGELVDLPIVSEDGDGGTLRLQVNAANIRAASIVSTTSEVGRIAALDSTVVADLAALVGLTVTGAGTALQTAVNDLRSNYEAHRVLIAAGEHLRADAANTCSFDDADSQEGAILLLNDLREQILAHMTTNDPALPWHTEMDLKSMPLAPTATDLASATVLCADLRERVYERHRVLDANPTCHGVAGGDATNTLNAPEALDDLIVSYLDAIAAAAPTAPTGEVDGAVAAAHYYGFTVPE